MLLDFFVLSLLLLILRGRLSIGIDGPLPATYGIVEGSDDSCKAVRPLGYLAHTELNGEFIAKVTAILAEHIVGQAGPFLTHQSENRRDMRATELAVTKVYRLAVCVEDAAAWLAWKDAALTSLPASSKTELTAMDFDTACVKTHALSSIMPGTSVDAHRERHRQ